MGLANIRSVIGILFLSLSIQSFGETPPPTGYAQTSAYRDAISGHHPNVMDEPLEVRQVVELSPFQRDYLRLRGARDIVVFDHIKNDSNFSYIPKTDLPTTQQVHSRQRELSVAWGRLWDSIALEAEVYLPKAIDYVATPLLTGASATFDYTAHIQQTGFFGNASYVVGDFQHLQPYLSIGVGGTFKRLFVTQSGSSEGERKYWGIFPAWNAGAGVSLQLSKNFGLDWSYRHMNLGHTHLRSVHKTNHTKLKSTNMSVRGYMLGFFWRY